MNIRNLFLILALLLGLTPACNFEPDATDVRDTRTEPQDPLLAELTDQNLAANEAWAKKDGNFFESLLTDAFFGVGKSSLRNKAMVVKSTSENPCYDLSRTSSNLKVVNIADGAAVLAGKSETKANCNGNTTLYEYFASLYVREGDSWKVAYHETLEVDQEGEGDGLPSEEVPPDLTLSFASHEEFSSDLEVIDARSRLARAKGDIKHLEEVMTEGYTELGITGLKDRAAVLKDVSKNDCKDPDTSWGKAVEAAKNIYILRFAGLPEETCGVSVSSDPDDNPITLNTTIYVKNGDNWKAAFQMRTLREGS